MQALTWTEFLQLERDADSKASAALLLAHSSTFNRRAFEHFGYSPWLATLDPLVDSLRPFAVLGFQIPLSTLTPEPEDNLSGSTSTIPARREESLTRHLEFTITTMAITERSTAKQFTLSDKEALLNILNTDSWDKLRVSGILTLAVVEIKRTAGRHFQDVYDFTKALGGQLSNAYADAHDRAWVAFEAEPKLRRIVVIIASAEWWMWGILTRPYTKSVIDNKKKLGHGNYGAYTNPGANNDTQVEDGLAALQGQLLTAGSTMVTDESDTSMDPSGDAPHGRRRTAAVAAASTISSIISYEKSSNSEGFLDGERKNEEFKFPWSIPSKGKVESPPPEGPFRRWKVLDESAGLLKMQQTLPEGPGIVTLSNDSLPFAKDYSTREGWSGCMPLGSTASYQQLFKIYQVLHADFTSSNTNGLQDESF
ncbi:hypothetical protein EST38_g3610 [Candolleomyces aberdarensis]|uniref:Uncharacterized protein n=1 Tax=Candolleomyces aberdarensis TaxID=2316362 RepID=A0A4Q2DQB0_9AGAR|nr:hypothetical protein EST38_g3610 [Candolleomyces aberdarensis]